MNLSRQINSYNKNYFIQHLFFECNILQQYRLCLTTAAESYKHDL